MYNTWTTIKVVMSILTDVCIFVQQSQQNLVSATALQQLEMRRRRWCGLVAEGFESLSTYKSNPTFCDTTFFSAPPWSFIFSLAFFNLLFLVPVLDFSRPIQPSYDVRVGRCRTSLTQTPSRAHRYLQPNVADARYFQQNRIKDSLPHQSLLPLRLHRRLSIFNANPLFSARRLSAALRCHDKWQ